MEIAGILLLSAGLCSVIACIGVAFDDERAKDEKPRIQQSAEEMRAKLVAAKIPDDQVAGLLQIHRSALVGDAVHRHFIMTSFLVLMSLLTASFGFSLMLLGKVGELAGPSRVSIQKDECKDD